jgi:hypothetical protein
MPDADKLTPVDPSDLAAALAYALRYQGRKRVHNADELMAEIVVKPLVEHLERTGFVVMKRPAEIGATALGPGFEGRVRERQFISLAFQAALAAAPLATTAKPWRANGSDDTKTALWFSSIAPLSWRSPPS